MSNLPPHVLQYVNEVAKDECMSEIDIKTEVRPFTGDNFLGEIMKVQLVGKCQGKEKTLNLIIKKSPESVETRNQMNVRDYYRNEIFTYEKILPAFNELQEKYQLQNENRFTFAKVYKHSFQELKELIIMEDLSFDGYTMWERRKPLDNDHMIQIMKELARLHALSFVMNNENPKLFNTLAKSIANSENYGEFISVTTASCMKLFVSKLADEKCKRKLIELRCRASQTMKKCLDAKNTEPYNVICHGDSFRNNILFKYKNGCLSSAMLIDWQIVRYASPATDLCYAICLSTDKITRAYHLSSWLNTYYECLTLNISKMGYDVEKCYPKKIFNEQLNEMFQFGVIMATLIIPHLLKEPGHEKNIDEISENLKTGDLDVDVRADTVERLEGLLTDFID